MLSGVSEEQIRTAIDRYTSNLSARNIDRVYDEFSSDEIDTIFKSLERTKNVSKEQNVLRGLVQESIQDTPDLTVLDAIEQDQVMQQRAIIEQKDGKNQGQNIGD